MDVRKDIAPGIYEGIPNESYHEGPGVSKSGLWTIETQSPAHFRFGEREPSKAFDFGEACHLAILQPDLFETKVFRGPDDRRGNKWKDAADWCASEGKLLLTSGDYDGVMTIRDAIHADAWINGIITGGHQPFIEASAYWRDEATGTLCRVRPDLYREDLGVILDVKSTVSAHPDAFARSVVNFGYHAQEAFYTDGWRGFKEVNGFAFLAFEKKPPYAFAVYELPPSIVEEGRALMRKALDTYTECERTGRWPAYGEGVQELSFKRWSYKLTDAPTGLDGEAAA